MSIQPIDLATLKNIYGEQIRALAQKYKLENVRVFGSVARGEAGPDSDIDLLVHGLPGCKLLRFEREMNEIFAPVKIDVVDDEELHTLLAPYILHDATPL